MVHLKNIKNVVMVVSLYLHKLSKVELGSLEDLDFTDEDILKRVDTLSCLLNILPNRFWNKLGNKLLEVTRRSFLDHDLPHLAANLRECTQTKKSLNDQRDQN